MNLKVKLTLALALIASPATAVSELAARGYAVLPAPQQVKLTGPNFAVPRGRTEGAGAAAETLRERNILARLVLKPGSVSTPKNSGESYRLDLHPAAVTITANAPAGLFYGAQTVAQLANAGRLPEATITDWPDLPFRAIYWDDAHHLDRPAELKRAIRQAAFFKINEFVLKLEGHFQFASAPAVVEPYALTPAEYQELTDYGLRYHVELVPYLDAPAHIAFILKHPEYARLRAFPDSNYEACATNPEAVALLAGMFQDLVRANKGVRHIYLSTDEPYYLGMPDNAQCRESGPPGKLFAEFTEKIARPLHEEGRTVIFWGEYPLKEADISLLPPYLVNGETYGPKFDPLFHQRGIRQMIYVSTQGEERMFPMYFPLQPDRRLHPARAVRYRVEEAFEKISSDPARQQTDVIGAIVAGWADAGLHPETFWLGYASIAAAAWRPHSPGPRENMSAFYPLFYGPSTVRMDRVYQLMSEQAQFWSDSWDRTDSTTRKPLFGNSKGPFQPRKPADDQTLPLSPNARRLELAQSFLRDNDELTGLLHENLRRAEYNRYNLEVFLALARLFRQDQELLLAIDAMASALEARQFDAAAAILDRVERDRDEALRNATEVFYKSWYPRVPEANGRKFLPAVDDVKDHLPDRTIDMSYLVLRQLHLPLREWLQRARNAGK